MLKPQGPAASQPDLEQEILAAIEVNGSDYRTLAVGRANIVKEYILKSGKIESERLFLTDLSAQGASTNGSRAYLHLK